MELKQLRQFMVAAQYEHITRAAEVLQIAQPALTQSIRKLERDLGVALFNQDGRNISLSAAGRMLQERLQLIMPALDNLPNELQNAEKQANTTIRIKMISACSLTAQAIAQFRQKHPEVTFCSVSPDDHYDFSIHTRPIGATPERDSVEFHEELFLAVSESSHLAKRKFVDLSELRNERFIFLENYRVLRPICDYYCLLAGFTPHIVFNPDSPAQVRELVRADMGITFWPQFSWGPQFNSHIVLIPIRNPKCERVLVVQRGDSVKESPLLNEFYECLLDTLYAAKKQTSEIQAGAQPPAPKNDCDICAQPQNFGCAAQHCSCC